MNIAIVDDESMNRGQVASLLDAYFSEKNIEYTLFEFASGEDVLEAPEVFHIVFMDIYMPGMNGVDAAKEIRETDPDAIIIFLTGSTDHMSDAFSLHAFDYVVKPASKAAITKVLDDALKVLPQSAAESSHYIEFICTSNTIKLFLRDVAAITVNGHTLTIMDKSGKEYETKQSFASLTEPIMKEKNFILANRGVLLNMDYISECKDGAFVVLDHFYGVKVREKTTIFQNYQDYLFEKSK